MSIKNTHYAYLLPSKESGITTSWKECEEKVKGINGARYQGFKNLNDAKNWLLKGALYKTKIKPEIINGIYFDAGTGRGNGVEISVTNHHGENLLHYILPSELINTHNKHSLSKEKTNNYGELLACKYAIKIANLIKEKKVFGDSKLVIDFWSKGMIKKEVNEDTQKLAKEIMILRKNFEQDGGKIILISGDNNPADLGFHK